MLLLFGIGVAHILRSPVKLIVELICCFICHFMLLCVSTTNEHMNVAVQATVAHPTCMFMTSIYLTMLTGML